MVVEIVYRFFKNENMFIVGGLYELDILIIVKVWLNNYGKLVVLF